MCVIGLIPSCRYRFNGEDRRLDRCLETAVMVMEALDGFEQKCALHRLTISAVLCKDAHVSGRRMAQCRRYAYAIVGHSGESAAIPFVDFGNAPSNRKERLKARRTACARTAIAVLVEYSPTDERAQLLRALTACLPQGRRRHSLAVRQDWSGWRCGRFC